MISQYHKESTNIYKVSTKVDNLEPSKKSPYQINKSVLNSIQDLNVDSLETLYLHQNEIDIISDKKIMNSLENLKVEGYVKKLVFQFIALKNVILLFKVKFMMLYSYQ